MLTYSNEKYRFYFLYFLIGMTTLPFIFAVNPPLLWSFASLNFKPVALYLSAIAGYAGVSLLLWQFILGTRSVTGLFFNNLPKTLAVHRFIGKYGILLIFLHPMLITYNYGESLFYSLTPDFSGPANTAITYGRFALYCLAVVWFTSAILRGKIKYRPWKYIHYLVYILLPLIFLHSPKVGSSHANTAIQFYWYLFIFIFLAFAVLRLRYLFGYGKVAYKIVSQQKVTDQVYLMRLMPEQKKLAINLGQYIYVQRNLLSEEHPFTVFDLNKNSGEISIAYKLFGGYTKKLARLPAGSSVLIDGPYGIFTKELSINPNKPTVFLAGGIGITPFIKHLLNKSPKADYKLFFANRHKEEAAFREILKNKLYDNYVDIISDDKPRKAHNEEYGHINKDILEKYINNPEDYQYYLCGPLGFMQAATNGLLSIGVSKSNIHTEKFEF